jgi:hypothetical protein
MMIAKKSKGVSVYSLAKRRETCWNRYPSSSYNSLSLRIPELVSIGLSSLMEALLALTVN